MMPSSNITVRPLAESDLERAAALERECFSDPWSAEMIREELENGLGVFFAAVTEAGDLVGYAGMQDIAGEGNLTNVAVTQSLRRCGIGKALVGALIAEAQRRRLDFVTLEVRESNAPAIALYKSFGFQPVGRRPGYYHQPEEAAILMTLHWKEEQA